MARKTLVQLKLGDCIKVMQKMPNNYISTIVTDPPYGLGFMGKKWDELPPGKEWAEECLRVLKPGGHLLAFGGTRTYHRLAVVLEDVGFEIRDCIAWLYGQGFPKSRNQGNGWGTALKPAFEPIVVARKFLEGTVSANMMKFGTGGINIDACRVGKTKNVPASLSKHAARDEGVYKGNQDGSWGNEKGGAGSGHDPNIGRWPANLVLDKKSARLLDAQGVISKPKKLRKGKRGGKGFGFFDDDSSAAKVGVWPGDNGGGVSRFFYCAKTGKAERNAGLEGFELKKSSSMPGRRNAEDMSNSKIDNDVTSRFVTVKQNIHPTVKPISLMRWLVRLVTPPGGIVLDPFMGSGTTGIACVYEKFGFIGIEKELEYLEISRARIKYWREYVKSN